MSHSEILTMKSINKAKTLKRTQLKLPTFIIIIFIAMMDVLYISHAYLNLFQIARTSLRECRACPKGCLAPGRYGRMKNEWFLPGCPREKAISPTSTSILNVSLHFTYYYTY